MSKPTTNEVLMEVLRILKNEKGESTFPTSSVEENELGSITITGNPGNIEINYGDQYEDTNQFINTTLSSINRGISELRKQNYDDFATGIQNIVHVIGDIETREFSDKEKQDALEILNEFTQNASSSKKSKPVLKALVNGLWEGVKNIDKISKLVDILSTLIDKF